MKQGLYSNEWISVKIQPAEINPKAYRVEVVLIVSLKTLVENFNLIKSYHKTNPTVFVFCPWEKYRWGLTSFGQHIFKMHSITKHRRKKKEKNRPIHLPKPSGHMPSK